ncbi:MAG: hypothetical protein HY907_06415 [Deltaproteobacteria bacterium]|nr:hypothetical protein [Deltaproteobacteria bacterium]
MGTEGESTQAGRGERLGRAPHAHGLVARWVAPSLLAAFLLAWSVGVRGDPPGESQLDLGMRWAESSVEVTLEAQNVSCDGAHTFLFEIQGATWLTIPGSRTVTVPKGETGTSTAVANLRGLAPGTYHAKVKVSCTSCPPPPACEVDRTTFDVSVDVNVAATFGADPRDSGLATFGNGIADCCTLLTQLSTTLGRTGFGQGARGAAILKRLDEAYLENGCSDVTFIETIDGDQTCRGVPVATTVEQYGVSPGPGEAVYFSNSLGGEEIAIGLDLSTRGIWQARKSPADYYVCLVDGRMAVVKRQDLVHNFAHEGLHALREGTYNLNGRACLEEERDAFAAGNEACEAMHLPLSTDAPGPGYGATPNPGYQPVTGR